MAARPVAAEAVDLIAGVACKKFCAAEHFRSQAIGCTDQLDLGLQGVALQVCLSVDAADAPLEYFVRCIDTAQTYRLADCDLGRFFKRHIDTGL